MNDEVVRTKGRHHDDNDGFNDNCDDNFGNFDDNYD